MTYSSPPRVTDLKTCADLLALVDYSTALEGSAVVAALEPRRRDNALDRDEDYVAPRDDERMRELEALAVIDRMSGGNRHWYRVGARRAMRIEAAEGRPALVERITRGGTFG